MNEQSFEDPKQELFYNELSKVLKDFHLDFKCGKRIDSPQPYALRVLVRFQDDIRLHVIDYTWKQIDRVLSFEEWERSLYFKVVWMNTMKAFLSDNDLTHNS